MSSHILFEQADISSLPRPSYIIEVGTIREEKPEDHAENSTCFFKRIAERWGFQFLTVDFSPESIAIARAYVGDRAVLSDGVAFLNSFGSPISILYLDNFDVVYNEKHKASLMRRVGTAYELNHETITNERSAEVHLRQMEAAFPLLTTPAYVAIDDTIEKPDGWWGKGARVVPYLLDRGFSICGRGPDGVLLTRGRAQNPAENSPI